MTPEKYLPESPPHTLPSTSPASKPRNDGISPNLPRSPRGFPPEPPRAPIRGGEVGRFGSTRSEASESRPSEGLTNGRRSDSARTTTALHEWVQAHATEIAQWLPVSSAVDPGCLVAACDRSTFGTGLCRAHYKRASRALRAEGRRSS